MLLFTLIWTLFASAVLASFGYTDEGTYWTIDNGKNLVIEVSQTNGDIQSMKYNVCKFQYTNRMDLMTVLITPIQRGSSTMAIATRIRK